LSHYWICYKKSRNELSMNKAQDHHNGPMTETERGHVYGLEFKFIYRQFFREGAAFFFLCFYYFWEYTRLQTIYPLLDVLPFAFLALAFTLLFLISDKYREHPRTFLVFMVYGFILLTFFSMSYSLDSELASKRGYIYLNWMLVFFATISLVTNEKRFVLFLFLYLLWNFKMSQHGAISWAQRGFSFAGWGVGGPVGWFQNSGEYGLQMAMVCVISLCFYIGIKQYLSGWRKWLFISMPVTSFMSVLASSSRGDYLALIVALLWLALAAKGKRLVTGFLVLTVLVIGYLAMPTEMMERFSVAGDEDDYTSYTRETRWRAGFEIYKDNPVIGIGTGSWVAYYTSNFPRELGREGWGLAHNSFIEIIGEHGSVGLLFMILIFGGMFSLNKRTRSMAHRCDNHASFWLSRGLDAATVAYIIGGSFMSVFHYPYVWVHAAIIVSLYVVTKQDFMSYMRKETENTSKN